MMKKNGFTLAEVLITLAIIGVVATMTLPALMNNTAEQQAITGLKKGINTLTEAAQLSQAIDGFDFASMTSDSTDDVNVPSLYAMLANRTNVDLKNTGEGKYDTGHGAENFAVFLRDGSAVIFPADTKADSDNAEQEDDGLPHGIPIVYDTNGIKGPNVMSNCLGNAAGTEAGEEDSSDIEDCNDKAKRVIKDQFGVKLRGGYAVPNGAAARWAFAK